MQPAQTSTGDRVADHREAAAPPEARRRHRRLIFAATATATAVAVVGTAATPAFAFHVVGNHNETVVRSAGHDARSG